MSEHIQHINQVISKELGLMSKTNPDRPFITSLLSLVEAYTNKRPVEDLSVTEVSRSGRYKTATVGGKHIRQLRKDSELTQEELASLMVPPRSRGYIAQIERQERARVSKTTASAIAKALNIEVQDLTV